MPYCVINDCRDRNVSFHALPKDPSLRKVWIDYIEKQNGAKLEISKVTKLCSAHFTPDSFYNYQQKRMGFAKTTFIKPDAVPTIIQDQDKVCDAKPDSEVEEAEAEAEVEVEGEGEGGRVPHAVAGMCLLTALRWLRQQREALPQHRRVLRELHCLASRKREMKFSGPADSSAAYAGGNPSKRTRPERAVQRWVRVAEEGEEHGREGLYTHGTAPELSRVEDLVKVEVEVEVADGAKLALGTRRRPGRVGAAPVSGGRAGAERDGESADFTRADGRSSDKLKCEPAEISISDRAGAGECGWG